MKTTFRIFSIGVAVFSLICFQSSTIRAQQVTAFTYQGQLKSNNVAANGNFVMSFALYNAASNGTAVVGPIVLNPVGVTNGLFTVALDFGSSPYASPSNWLGIEVGTNLASLTNLLPRQLLTPTPYAIMAGSASNLLGTVPAGQINGNVPGVLLSNTVLAVNCPSGGAVNYSTTPTLLQTIGSFTKGTGSTVEVIFDGKIYVQTMSNTATGAIFELRVDNTATTHGVARANLFSSQTGFPGEFRSMTGVFTGLAPGSHTVSMWIYGFFAGGTGAQLDPGCWGTDHLVVNEFQ